ncbi:uncharacterized protein LOC112465493 [Temnothorax curvispinosus]|uniref:Uncharacterized protein LOC112465493 n=1 Tax=Temnothorax curvispinosus TaxID=300111 RepID=A0A6J1R1F5_9HYME|nr:uncharacterized protein LOC112465493 [Temnothorax curvispinosus]XP_024888825.1 uncharacterized protein LOC112465493 [Temnothorax curvispinosus]XP_024888826.1 uncharacterized protein LOC112465493 [Temnothorax curvispinosus]
MNEMRHVLTGLKTPAKSSTLSSGIASAATATWYDVPMPIIVHCHEFHEEAERQDKNDEARKKRKRPSEDEMAMRLVKENTTAKFLGRESPTRVWSSKDATSSRPGGLSLSPDSVGEVSRSETSRAETVAVAVAVASRSSRVCVSDNLQVNPAESRVNNRTRDEKRHSTTMELNATTTLKTDADGVPTISFSFLRAGENFHENDDENGDEIVILEVDTSDQADLSGNQLYDFPKSAILESSRASLERPGRDKDQIISGESSLPAARQDPYDRDMPKLTCKDVSWNESREEEVPTISNTDLENDQENYQVANAIVSPEKKNQQRDRMKRSTRSLKSGRRSYGASDSDGYDAGIASMSGSYSDPECPHGAGGEEAALSESGGSDRGKRLRLQKRRLGKAWGRMRSWLREEKTRIGQVVNRHAKLQAVGALNPEVRSNRATPVQTSKSKQRGFYDLTRAHTQESGSITRVEEFGLSSVSEEVNVSDDIERPTSASPDSGNTSANDARRLRGNLRRKTASSDDILENNRTRLQLPGSFSMDKLCSRVTENDEMKVTTATATAPTPVVTMAMAGTSGDAEASRDYGGKSGLIKRRMLGSIRGLMASTHLLQTYESDEGGQGGFEDVRRYVKQGGDFCKELASILHERAELEATYAKGLSKLSSKLTKACAKDQGGNSNGGVNEAWRCVGEEMEAAAEAHRLWGIALSEQLAKPLRVGVAETQGRSRKSIENSVDKASKSLQEWRGVTAKSKKQSFACARENERLQDLARLQTIGQSQQSNNRSSSHQMTEKEASKLEARRRKAEDSSRRADTEFYTVSVRAERARLEYESTMRKGAKQMELLEEERLSALKDLANVYLTHLQALAPRLQQSVDRLLTPVRSCNVSQDLEILKNLVRRMDNHDVTNAEQLLPDFYAEHVTLAMNRERRKQALVRVLHLIRQDLERERRGREGLETLHRAFVKTPAFAADESTQNVTDKLHHMRSMLLYLEAARYKVGGTLAEVEGSKRSKHPLSEHILVSRDKQGLQQSVLKIPSWTKNESFEIQDSDVELEMHLTKDQNAETRDWADRTAGDGNSENPPDEDDFSDFDEFSSHSEDNNNQIDGTEVATAKTERTEQCRAIYQYSANLNDELSLSPGDLITVHQKQPDGWWIGECRGRTGIFPATYVQVIH